MVGIILTKHTYIGFRCLARSPLRIRHLDQRDGFIKFFTPLQYLFFFDDLYELTISLNTNGIFSIHNVQSSTKHMALLSLSLPVHWLHVPFHNNGLQFQNKTAYNQI